MKNVFVLCCLLFFSLISSIFLVYYIKQIFRHIQEDHSIVDNVLSFQALSSDKINTTIFANRKKIFSKDDEDYYLTEDSYYDLESTPAEDIRFLDYTTLMKNGIGKKELNDRIAQFLAIKYNDNGVVFYKLPFTTIWYNLFPYTFKSSNITCLPIRVFIETTFDLKEVSDEKKYKLLNENTFPEDIKCDKNGCFEFFIREKLPLKIIKSCFDPDFKKFSITNFIANEFSNFYENDSFSGSKMLFAKFYDQSYARQLVFSMKEAGNHEKKKFKHNQTCVALIENPGYKLSTYNGTFLISDEYNVRNPKFKVELELYFTYLRKIKKIYWKSNPCYKEVQNKLFIEYYNDCKEYIKSDPKYGLLEEINVNSEYCCKVTALTTSYMNLNRVKSHYFFKPSLSIYDHCKNTNNYNISNQCILSQKKLLKNRINLDNEDDDFLEGILGPYKFEDTIQSSNPPSKDMQISRSFGEFSFCKENI
ncbi:hypothetical protein EDEG_02290 [Edhazardia aedis USNM 41457]|uniref:Uncharacterized protein n=1 Tax=Edhazardia aedis (strain USNM 41457) TaxID=1003232 RepID=J9DLB0_EDHAE|nr:hypothetical protein EDEG_02290 [Edhazardia aedis USNM 41457]|eukprot:EJW03380.1 hypothetical protein EDEG_02290 [Edhazardia aedis USNM 41457]